MSDQQTQFVVTDEDDLNAAIQAIDVGGTDTAANTSYDITFDLSAEAAGTLTLTSALTALNLETGSNVTIDGQNDTLSGGGTRRGLFVYSGAVTVENLTIADAKALGGSGSGGGAGLGGGLFVAGTANGGAAHQRALCRGREPGDRRQPGHRVRRTRCHQHLYGRHDDQ